MNTIKIPTTQFIELEYPIAGTGNRLLAGLIDLVVLLLYFLAILFLLYGGNFPEEEGFVVFLFLQIPAMVYSLVCEVFAQGQTLGKWLLKLRTIRLDGTPPTVGDYLLRWILRLVDVWLSAGFAMPGAIGLISIGVTKNGQRLGDLAAGTSVVRLQLVTTFADTIFRETDETYRVTFPEITRLSDRDLTIIKEVMDHAKKSKDEQLLSRLAFKIKTVSGIETEFSDSKFLEIVFNDYNHIFSESKR